MKAFYDFFVSDFRIKDSQRIRKSPKLLLHFCVIAALFCGVYAIVCLSIGFVLAVYVNLGLFVLFVACIFLHKTTISFHHISQVFLVVCFAGLVAFIYLSGGIASVALSWICFIPITAILLIDLRRGVVWLGLGILVILGFAIAGTLPNQLPKQGHILYSVMLNTGLACMITWLTSIFVQIKEKSQQVIQAQNLELKIQKEEMLVQNEELLQQKEEVVTQRDFIEKKNQEMKFLNNKLGSSERVLRKAVKSLRESQQKISNKNEVLEQRDRFIQKSIRSAVTIQETLLPHPQKLNELLRDYFIIYYPKDKVSGDFYWLNKVACHTILVVSDCTGHGIPGAFMTMIGNTLLDKIINTEKITSPAAILDALHTEIQLVLRQKETQDINGMDAAVVSLEQANGALTRLTFAGAKNSLFYLPKGESLLYELKGARKSLGGIQNENKQFVNHVLNLAPESLIYLGSDGLQDQNDVHRKKFGKDRLIRMLNQIALLPLSGQKEKIEEALHQQMINTTQRDDILWLGIRI
ncbi:SpoIIE family protein phosphatase [uncultured Microscilla sp.]|uniref:SpoIIE family protein phosphatase n=1 Tax=uncultured Microscilla sp. TaxID=432653 RepID=UPI002615ABB9|nr:SpoIIE family protein phosphatase [uncultured Microscilla sp.]